MTLLMAAVGLFLVGLLAGYVVVNVEQEWIAEVPSTVGLVGVFGVVFTLWGFNPTSLLSGGVLFISYMLGILVILQLSITKNKRRIEEIDQILANYRLKLEELKNKYPD